MPFETHWTEQGVEQRASGKVDLKMLQAMAKDLYVDPRFQHINYQVLDFTGVEGTDLSGDDIAQIAVLDKSATFINSNNKMAVVASSDVFSAFASYYEIESETSSWEVEVFDSIDTARAWVQEPSLSK